MAARVLAVMALVVATMAACNSEPHTQPAEGSTGTTTGGASPAPEIAQLAWSAALPGTPRMMEPTEEEGRNPVVGDDVVVVLGEQDATAYAVSDGAERWRVDMGGGVCAAAPQVVDGLVVVLTGAAGQCDRVVALAADDGSELWEHPLRAPVSLGDEVTVGHGVVTLLPFCRGFLRFDAATGAVLSEVGGEGACAAGDGTTIAVAQERRLTAYDQATGEEIGSWSIEPFRLRDVLASDPLVVTGQLGDETVIADVRADGLGVLDAPGNRFSGGSITQLRDGDTLWGDFYDVLVGVDVSGRGRLGVIPLGVTRHFAGLLGEDLVVLAASRPGTDEVQAHPAAAPEQQRVLARIESDATTRGAAVAGGRLIRITEDALEAYDLPG